MPTQFIPGEHSAASDAWRRRTPTALFPASTRRRQPRGIGTLPGGIPDLHMDGNLVGGIGVFFPARPATPRRKTPAFPPTTTRRSPTARWRRNTTPSRFSFSYLEWAEHAPGLKSINDALRIRREILFAFEKAK